jgi:hypothetical protein
MGKERREPKKTGNVTCTTVIGQKEQLQEQKILKNKRGLEKSGRRETPGA